MSQKELRYPQFFTPHHRWISEQNRRGALGTEDGYVMTDLDFMWCNAKKKKCMLIEEKCRMAEPSRTQRRLLLALDRAMRETYAPDRYLGLHLVQFEFERPDDGGTTFVDGCVMSPDEYIQWLQFDSPKEVYKKSWFKKS